MERSQIQANLDIFLQEKRIPVRQGAKTFTRYFYNYRPLRSLAEIRADILALEEETEGMIHEVVKG